MPVEPITSVEQFVARFENSTLDFKTNYDLARRETRRDIAVDVAAFANAFGGTIVVGVCERAGRIERIDGVVNVPRLLKETATALQQFCVPVPGTPEENAFTVTPADAGRLLARGATAPSADVTIVTLYVRPDPRGPIGVRAFPKGAETEGMSDLYRFPVRIDDQTRPLDPTELPMWMNSHERRIAIRLRAIPQGSVVQTFEEGDRKHVVFEGLDEVEMITMFSLAGAGRAHVPLTHVTAVWVDARSGEWTVQITGRVFRTQPYVFEPR